MSQGLLGLVITSINNSPAVSTLSPPTIAMSPPPTNTRGQSRRASVSSLESSVPNNRATNNNTNPSDNVNLNMNNENNDNDNEDDESVSPERREEIKLEKSFISFQSIARSKQFRNFYRSFWGTVRYIDYKKLSTHKGKISEDSLLRMEGLLRCFDMLEQASEDDIRENDTYKSINKRMVVCPLCFENPNKSLDECLLGLGDGISSNIKQHHDAKHPHISASLKDDDTNNDPTQSTMKQYSGTMVSRSDAKSLLHQAIYRFVNDNGFPARTVEKDSFRELLQCAIANAPKLSPKDCEISNKAITKMRLLSYNEFVATVTMLGNKVRAAYALLCGKPIAFATICHDIWQGNNKDILGITLVFTDPRNGENYKIPIGLANVKGHTAVQVAEHTAKILKNVSFTQTDLCSSVNDNTNSAVLAGKYIIGNNSGGKCDMHRAELILKHATGLAVRKRHGEVIDSNPSFMKIYQIFFKFSSWLMSSRSPKRFQRLKEYAQKNHRHIIKIQMPNTTRVTGCIIMTHDLFRDKHTMDAYKNQQSFETNKDKDFVSKYPKESEWQALAEFEGVLLPLKKCAMSLQVDDPSASAGSLLEIYNSKFCVEIMKEKGIPVLVLDRDAPGVTPWDASETIHSLQSKRTMLPYNDALESTKKLIDRILIEYKTYMMEGDDVHAEHAMLGHPFLCYLGPSIMKEDIKVYDDNDIKRIRRQFVMDVVQKFTSPTSSTSSVSGSTQETPHVEDNASTDDLRDASQAQPTNSVANVMDAFNIFKAHRRTREREHATLTSMTGQAAGNGRDQTERAKFYKQCDNEFGAYLNFCETVVSHSWADLIQQFPTPLYDARSKTWTDEEQDEFLTACAKEEFHDVAQYFNVMQWWMANRTQFPKIFPSAIIWISKPATNAYQERVFSTSSWFDRNPLMNRQGNKVFELRTIESLSRPIRKTISEREKDMSNNKVKPELRKTTSKAKPKGRRAAAAAAAAVTGVEDGSTHEGAIEVMDTAREIVEVSDSSTQGELGRLEKILDGTTDLQGFVVQGSALENGVSGQTYKFKKLGDNNEEKVEEWDDVELIDLVQDKTDREQMEALNRKIEGEKDNEDSDERMVEVVEERKTELQKLQALQQSLRLCATGEQSVTGEQSLANASKVTESSSFHSQSASVSKKVQTSSQKRKGSTSKTKRTGLSSQKKRKMKQQSLALRFGAKKAPPEQVMAEHTALGKTPPQTSTTEARRSIDTGASTAPVPASAPAATTAPTAISQSVQSVGQSTPARTDQNGNGDVVDSPRRSPRLNKD